MPVPFRESPEFNPYGRYALNVKERREPGPTYFHDMEEIKESCLSKVPTTSISRFNNINWALQLGYQPCTACAEGPA